MKPKQINTTGISIKIAIKLFVVIILFVLLFSTASASVELIIAHNEEENDVAGNVNSCERYYREREYASLREYLLLFDIPKEDPFLIYWEAEEAYVDYMDYMQWSEAAQKNIEGASKKAQYYRERVLENAKNIDFPDNETLLKGYAEQIMAEAS